MAAWTLDDAISGLNGYKAAENKINQAFAAALAGNTPEEPVLRIQFFVGAFLKSHLETLNAYHYDLGDAETKNEPRRKEFRNLLNTLENVCDPGKKEGAPDHISDGKLLSDLKKMLSDALVPSGAFESKRPGTKERLAQALAAVDELKDEIFPNIKVSIDKFIIKYAATIEGYCQELINKKTSACAAEAEDVRDLMMDLSGRSEPGGKPLTYHEKEADALQNALTNATTAGHEFASADFLQQLREALRDLQKINHQLFHANDRVRA